ncbi:MAG: ABC transporter ATP-binding protein, partial [Firmicutes bacterium]|nr:ABC transporter ATP-binding protein [Bacillota bacterium]
TARLLSFVAQGSTGCAMTVYDTILLGRKPYMKMGISKEDHQVVEEVILRLGLQDLSFAFLDQISGGERQKVMLARALAQQPRVLLLDEPTSNLDLKNQYEVMGLISEICVTEGLSAVVVIHDLNLALRYCNKLLFLKEGRVYAFGGPEVVTPELLREVYGVHAEVRSEDGQLNIRVY